MSDRPRGRRSRSAPSSGWSWPSAGSSSRTCWTACRSSTSTSRCYPAGGERRRSSGPSWPATPITGVCLMAIDEGLDTGPGVPLRSGGDRPGGDRGRAAGPPGRRWAPTCWSTPWPGGLGRPDGPGGTPTYADKIEPADLQLDWSPARRRAAPGGAPRAGLDHVAGPAPAGPGRPVGRRLPAGGPPGQLGRASWSAPATAACELLTVQPEGRRPHGRRRLAAGRPARPGRAARVVSRAAPASAAPASRASTRRLAVDALIGIDDGAWANVVVPELLRRQQLDEPGPGSGHRAGVRHLPHAASV